MKYKFSILALLIFTLFPSFANAQYSASINPYTNGEFLSYEGKFNKLIFRGASIADLSFSTSKAADNKNYSVTAEAVSKGTLLKIFRFKFYQKIISTVDGERFVALKTVKRDEQDERVRDSEASFDYAQKKVIYVETDPKDANRPPRRIASSIEDETFDLNSAIFKLRSLPLSVGKNFTLTVSDSGLIYQVPLTVKALERQDTILGKVMCFRIEPLIFGKGRMIEDNNGEMVIWITDDNRRIPVRSTIKTTIAKMSVKVDIKLRKYEIRK